MSQQPPQQHRGEDTQLKQHNSDGVAEMATNTDTANAAHQNGNGGSSSHGKVRAGALGGIFGKVSAFGGIRFLVLMILCLQNSMFTVLRRYSLGVLKEDYSKVRRELIKDYVAIEMRPVSWTDEDRPTCSAFPMYAQLLHVIALLTPPFHHEMQLLVLTHNSFTVCHCLFTHLNLTVVISNCFY